MARHHARSVGTRVAHDVFPALSEFPSEVRMRRWSPGTRLSVALLLLSVPALARDLPNYHQVYSAPPRSAPGTGIDALNRRVPRASSALAAEPRFALPTVIRAPYTGQGTAPAARTPVDAARQHVQGHAAAYFLGPSEVDALVPIHLHDTGRGAIIVKFVSRPGGLEVWGEQLNVVMDRQLRLVGITGYVSTPGSAEALYSARAIGSARTSVAEFQVDHAGAVAAAYGDLTGTPLGAGAFAENGVVRGEYHSVEIRGGVSTPSKLSFPARARQVLFHSPGRLEPAYYVEVAALDPEVRTLDYVGYVISGRNAKVLVRTNLAARAQPFTYRVWADAAGIHQPFISPVGNGEAPAPAGGPGTSYTIPPAVARNDISVASGPISTKDPWLKDDATETVGNNVRAYADVSGGDGYNPPPGGTDFTAPTSGTRAFLYDWSDANGANTSRPQNNASITQLFYMNNWLHDWYYDHGFDEAAGNAQDDNYGRGPEGGDLDAMVAETNDFSGVDNANMWTPADGSPPRMQMYVFDGQVDDVTLTATATPPLTFPAGSVVSMAQGARTFDVTAAVVKAVPAAACSALTNAAQVAGKIVLIARGGDSGGPACGFDVKQANAVAAGAVGILIWNKTNGAFGSGFGTGSVTPLGNLFVDNARGTALDAAVTAGAVTAHMVRATQDLDGALDMGIVAHEWGHYIQHRLIAAGAQDSTQGAGMGEGWSDFHALLFMVREEDMAVPGNESWLGAYGAGNYASLTFNPDERWFGIRRVTYSADPAKNHVTFRFIRDVVLPANVSFPWLGAATDRPSEVHNTGEIWASMLFDCYVSLLQNYPFAEAQNRMKDYLVASYKVTPAFPTFVEARDALLQVVAASSLADYDRFGQAFANRGLGIGAVAPDRGDATNSTLTESFVWGNNLSVESVAVVDGTTNCDGDGVLDPGETGAIQVTVRNIGKATLTGATASASSTTTGVSFPAPGPTVAFADIAPGALATVRIPIQLATGSTVDTVAAQVTVTGTGLDGSVTATRNVSTGAVANLDGKASETKDDFEAVTSPWSIFVAPHTQQPPPGTVWGRFASALGDPTTTVFQSATNVQADESIVSPPLKVAATGDFTLAWKNAYANVQGSETGSGVVVEVSSDDGATWTDIADVAGVTITNGYSGTIADADPLTPPNEHNPLAGRAAFTGVSPGLQATGDFDAVAVNFHGAFAGKTVLVRFRYGSLFDEFTTLWVYELDDFQVSGITNTPFVKDVPDAHVCVPIVDAGPDQTVNEQATATLTGSAPDLSGGPVTHTWTQVGGPAVTLSDPASLTPTFTAPQVDADALLTFQLSATGQNGTRTATTHVLVKDVGHPPVAVITGGNVTVAPGEKVTLDAGRSTDEDGGDLTFTWAQASGAAGTFSASTGKTVTFTAPGQEGLLIISVRATDPTGLSGSGQSALVVVKPASKSSGGCSSTGSPASALAALAVAAGLLAMRRRRA